MSEPLSTYVTRYLSDPDAFRRTLDAPVLLFEPSVDQDELTDPGDEEDYRLKTQTGVSQAIFRLPEGDGPRVFPVKKLTDNAFKRGVTIGRTSNNDVVLDDGSVSRFHAWILREPATGRWMLTDAGSKNGTFVQGVTLEPKRPQALGERARLRFGQVELVFHAPGSFFELVKRRAPRS